MGAKNLIDSVKNELWKEEIKAEVARQLTDFSEDDEAILLFISDKKNEVQSTILSKMSPVKAIGFLEIAKKKLIDSIEGGRKDGCQ